jgi:predicted GNAT family acetyltransferase
MSDFQIRREESESRGRYVTVIDGVEAELTFSKAGTGMIIADHTGVPREIGGRGVGLALAEAMIADARAAGIKVMPLCPFVNAQFKRHPDWSDLLP